jgi:hypothetical protein
MKAIGVELLWSVNRVAAGVATVAILIVVALTWQPAPAVNVSYRAVFALLIMGWALTWFGDELGLRDKTPGVVNKALGWVFLAGAAFFSVWLSFFLKRP